MCIASYQFRGADGLRSNTHWATKTSKLSFLLAVHFVLPSSFFLADLLLKSSYQCQDNALLTVIYLSVRSSYFELNMIFCAYLQLWFIASNHNLNEEAINFDWMVTLTFCIYLTPSCSPTPFSIHVHTDQPPTLSSHPLTARTPSPTPLHFSLSISLSFFILSSSLSLSLPPHLQRVIEHPWSIGENSLITHIVSGVSVHLRLTPMASNNKI